MELERYGLYKFNGDPIIYLGQAEKEGQGKSGWWFGEGCHLVLYPAALPALVEGDSDDPVDGLRDTDTIEPWTPA